MLELAAGSTYTPIATTTADGSSSQYTFNSISSSYTDLVVILSFPSAASGAGALSCQVNGDTATNYSQTYVSGDGTSAVSGRRTSQAYMRLTNYTDQGTYGGFNSALHFINYSNTTTYKTMLQRANQANSATETVVNLWRSTSAISSIKIYQAVAFPTGSTFTLYGILAA